MAPQDLDPGANMDNYCTWDARISRINANAIRSPDVTLTVEVSPSSHDRPMGFEAQAHISPLEALEK